MTRPPKPPRYTVIPHPDTTSDVAALATYEPEVVAAAVAIADDLAHGRVIGKELGDRHVSGNLTGFARVRFDVPGQRPQRFRLTPGVRCGRSAVSSRTRIAITRT